MAISEENVQDCSQVFRVNERAIITFGFTSVAQLSNHSPYRSLGRFKYRKRHVHVCDTLFPLANFFFGQPAYLVKHRGKCTAEC